MEVTRRVGVSGGLGLALCCLIGAQWLQSQTPTIRIDVSEVTIDVEVFNAARQPVTNLSRADFSVFDNGVLQPISHFAAIEAPYHVLLLIDGHTVSSRQWQFAESAVSAFLSGLRPQDAIAVGLVGGSDRTPAAAESLAAWGGRNALLREGLSLSRFYSGRFPARRVMPMRSDKGSSLYAGTSWALTQFPDGSQRKAAVFLTSGASSGNWDQWKTSQNQIVDLRDDGAFQELLGNVRRSGVRFYMIASATDLNPSPTDVQLRTPRDLVNLQQVRSRIQEIASVSGGISAFPLAESSIVSIYENIAREMGTAYTLGYNPGKPQPGRTHTIEVRLQDPAFKIRQSRTGYIEPGSK